MMFYSHLEAQSAQAQRYNCAAFSRLRECAALAQQTQFDLERENANGLYLRGKIKPTKVFIAAVMGRFSFSFNNCRQRNGAVQSHESNGQHQRQRLSRCGSAGYE
jgi:hypothetical protein